MAIFNSPTDPTNNIWQGTSEPDTFNGLATDDSFIGGFGADVYHGGDGYDGIWYDIDPNPMQGITIDLAGGWAFDPYNNFETFTSIEDMFGTRLADRAYGNEADNFFRGFAGDDFYDGRGGIDHVSFALEKGTKGVVLDFRKGKATDTYGDNDTLVNVEVVRGSRNSDKFFGSAADEQFNGHKGNDIIDGDGGIDLADYSNDWRYGGAAGVTVNLARKSGIDGFGDKDVLMNIEDVRGTREADVIAGDDGSNHLFGGAGDDILYGRKGLSDTLNGGDGADYFVIDYEVGKTGYPQFIDDFSYSDGDRLWLYRTGPLPGIGRLADSQLELRLFSGDKNQDGNLDLLFSVIPKGKPFMPYEELQVWLLDYSVSDLCQELGVPQSALTSQLSKLIGKDEPFIM